MPFSSSTSSSNRSSNHRTVRGPTEQLKSWQSGARLVKNTKVENQYLDHIRDMHDPSLHLKTIEDELKGTIGKALGKQGEKVLLYARLMHQERQKYDEMVLEKQKNDNQQQQQQQLQIDRELQKVARQHNQHRKDCLHARWELIVHRQAVGFIVGNHKYVTEKFPIAEALPEGSNEEDAGGDDATEQEQPPRAKRKKFGDQLDWWQQIGRWR